MGEQSAPVIAGRRRDIRGAAPSQQALLDTQTRRSHQRSPRMLQGGDQLPG